MNLKNTIERFHYELSVNELKKEKANSVHKSISHNSTVYLGIIAFMDSCTTSMLAEKLNISKPAITIKVNELEKQGLVEKTQSLTDKRVYYIDVSPDVKKIIEGQAGPIYNTIAKVESEFSKHEIDSFCRILNIFNDAFAEENK